MSCVLEAGHYYQAKGPTVWSRVGWDILSKVKQNGDQTILFIDDVHTLENMSEEERRSSNVSFNPEPDYFVAERDILKESLIILEILKNLPKKHRCRFNSNGRWFCSGFPITGENGFPNCILLDAGLTLRKNNLGFSRGINILPYFYQDQQKKLLRIIKKSIPNFLLEVILFDISGGFWYMQDK